MGDRDVSEGAPTSWFDGRARVLFVHAHPDDETIATGGTLAALAEAGREPLLVTLTRGEQGEVVAGPLEALVAAHGLAVARQNELRTALGMLGVDRHAFLGVEPARADGYPPVIYEDSGMEWGADGRATAARDASPDALTSAPAVEALNDLLAAAYQSNAQAVVSYDDGGGYGHPDHVLAHRLARAVAHALDVPFWAIVSDVFASETDPAAPASEAVEVHDVSPWLPRKVAALRGYATQLTVDGDEIVHVGGQREPIGTVEAFRRLTPAPEAHGSSSAAR
ncbi:PIG-L family deacetylase [Leucobacter sp. Marseille-Q4368]|uniref:PIG-L family deacetylase n=1 Tax=Leucobacter manosquensis TaxID=2810611 RepID=A0ABS5M633_9MICO|nr:PIG-L family deacetylase [Leucobacter manosquensis]MBS3182664.1 PIG-L family deacetylase [Leucobacter manosquensis]